MIKFDNVTKKYDSTIALKDVSFEIEDEFVVIAGKSGAGKTTLLEMILAKETPTSGKVLFDDMVVNELEGNDISDLRQRIGAIFQDYKLLTDRTAFENIGYAMRVVGASEEDIQKRVPQVLDIVDMKDCADSYPQKLSEGEQQR